MNLHEYQGKELLRGYGIAVPEGRRADTPEAAGEAARALGGTRWAVKAQIHAGLRRAAGGVRLVDTPEDAAGAAEDLLGSRLVTPQTGPQGKTVKSVYVERGVDYTREIYLAALVDRASARVTLIAAAEGGEEIEERAAADPELIRRLIIDPDIGVEDDAARALAATLNLRGAQADQAAKLMAAVYRAFVELDASLIEFNPLVVSAEGELLALDVKMVLDDNALFRHQDLAALRDEEELDPSELEAQRFELNYVKLAGDIGVMVNGAGLALATIDLLKQHGGEPADFMDVRPEATREQIAGGFLLLLKNPKVRAILVNVYGGGILRCDTVAEGIAAACKTVDLRVPLIVRAAGTNGELARKILVAQGTAATFADTMAEAAVKVVEATGREAR